MSSERINRTEMNGIDRVDNNKGYTLNNCVPCCKTCNQAKHRLSQEYFIEWVEKIYKHLKTNGLLNA